MNNSIQLFPVYVVDVMYGSVLKTQLKMFSKCVQFKSTQTQNILKILILFSKMVLNFAQSFVCAH